MVIKNGKVLLPGQGISSCDIRIAEGIIREIGPGLQSGVEIDASGLYVLPGLIDLHTHGIHAPNDLDLMEKFVTAFHKVFNNLSAALAHSDDEIYPGADGRLYGAG